MWKTGTAVLNARVYGTRVIMTKIVKALKEYRAYIFRFYIFAVSLFGHKNVTFTATQMFARAKKDEKIVKHAFVY